jgi:hypothetical protein
MNPKLYYYVAQGMITIDNIDDSEEMKLTDEAFDILNFTQVNMFSQLDLAVFNIERFEGRKN